MVELYKCYILILLLFKEYLEPNLRVVALTHLDFEFSPNQTLFFAVFSKFFTIKAAITFIGYILDP